jgi:HEAT repeat protein
VKLITVTLHGYKRFAEPSSMNVDGKLIAVVGPNEAGKSSFLNALYRLNDGDPFVTSGGSPETTRNVSIPDSQNIIEAKYLLDDADREAIKDIPGGEKARWFTLKKRKDGGFWRRTDPLPQRSLQPRKKAVKALVHTVSRQGFLDLAAEQESDLKGQMETLISTLDAEANTISSRSVQEIRDLATELENVVSEDGFKYLHELTQQLHDLAEYEAANLHKQVNNILQPRVPEFLFFTDEHRSLQPEYDLEQVWEQPPLALEYVRSRAMDGLVMSTPQLSGTPKIVEMLKEALRSNQESVRGRAIRILATHPSQSLYETDMAEALKEALKETQKSDEEFSRYRIVSDVATLTARRPELMQFLKDALNDDASIVRNEALRGVVKLADHSSAAVEVLKEALRSDYEEVWFQAASSLVTLGESSPEVLEVLLKGAEHATNYAVRRDCADLLGRVGFPDERIISALLNGLIDEDNEVRRASAMSLAKLPQRHTGAVRDIERALIQALEDPRFDNVDEYEGRTGHDYAFDGLWTLVAGEDSQ